MLFSKNKNRKTQEQLNMEFAELQKQQQEENGGDVTEVLDTLEDLPENPEYDMEEEKKYKPKQVIKPNYSQKQASSQPKQANDRVKEQDMSNEVKEIINSFDREYGQIRVLDQQSSILFAIYAELKKINIVLEEINNKA